MQCRLNWKRGTSISCFHALAAMTDGRELVNPKLARALEPFVARARSLSLPATFWQHIVPLSGTLESNIELARVTTKKCLGSGTQAQLLLEKLRDLIEDVEAAFAAAVPDTPKELMLRTVPLRQQWEARGPGLLTSMGRITEPDLIVEHVDVWPVYPALGGSGEAHLTYNSVRIEAVLADTHDKLPEVVRLAWLISQLNLDRPCFADLIHGRRLPFVAGLAMLPPTLQAAETVELCSYNEEAVHRALDAWHIGLDVAKTLNDWWEAYQSAKPRWPVAMTGLDRLLPADMVEIKPITSLF